MKISKDAFDFHGNLLRQTSLAITSISGINIVLLVMKMEKNKVLYPEELGTPCIKCKFP